MVNRQKKYRSANRQKLSLPEKERVLVLCSADRILWILGIRQDERTRITSGTGRILKIKCSCKREHVLLVICLLLHKHRRAANQTIHGHSDQVHTGWPVVSCDHMLLCTNARLFLPDQLSAIVKTCSRSPDCRVFSALTIRPDPAATGLGKTIQPSDSRSVRSLARVSAPVEKSGIPYSLHRYFLQQLPAPSNDRSFQVPVQSGSQLYL